MLLLAAFGFFLGYARPKGAWTNACILAVFVPLSQFAWILATYKYETMIAEGAGSLMAFVPAFAGTYGGRFIAHSYELKQTAANASV